MSPNLVNPESSSEPRRHTRREILHLATAAGVSALVSASFGTEKQGTTQPTSAPATEPPWWLEAPFRRSRVVDIRSNVVLRGSVVDEISLTRILDRGIRVLTDAPSTTEGWRIVLGEAQRIVLKFNSVGAHVINTTATMARTLVQALSTAGYKPADLTLVEAPDYLGKDLGTRPPEPGWGAPIPVGDNMEPIVNYWHAADAVINVPFLKTHQIAGMSGAMKNLSHAVIRHPALYHGGGCSPYIGQVIGNKTISSKLKLNVVNALRVVIRNGPEAVEGDLFEHSGLLLGYDPVAVDTVGLALLTSRRKQLRAQQPIDVHYLHSAAAQGVGHHKGRDLEQLGIEDE